MKIHYFYKITNLLNGKYYLGVHTSTLSPEKDNYWGSGPAIKAAIKKYGKQNFKKEVLEVFNSSEDAFKYEAEHITLKEVQDPMCYNMQLGGLGGTEGAIFMTNGTDHIRILPEFEEEYRNKGYSRLQKIHSAETLQKMRESHRGLKRSKESLTKAGASMRQLVWVKKEDQELRIHKNELESYLDQGYVRGRLSSTGLKISQTLKARHQNS